MNPTPARTRADRLAMLDNPTRRITLALLLAEGASIFAPLSTALALRQAPDPAGGILVAASARALLVALACVAGFWLADLYEPRVLRRPSELPPRLPAAVALAGLTLGAARALGIHALPGARALAASLPVSSLLLVALRLACRRPMRHGALAERVLILGSGALARALAREIAARPACGCVVVGTLGDDELPDGGPESGRRLARAVATARPDRIVVAPAERRGRLPSRRLLEFRVRGVVVEDGVATYEHLTGKLAIEALAPSALIFGDGFAPSRLHAALGRAASLAAVAAGLVVLLPAMAAIALAIRLDSPGPIFFVQPRLGRNGRPFSLVKFRTMRGDHGPSEWVADNRDRITRVGRWLRRCRLDELPQLLNILRGDMNLVGPRPHPVSNFTLFVENIPYYSLRCLVRPGLTGWAQVRYGYANTLEEETEKARYDLYYVKHMSPWLDLRILLETARAVLAGSGEVEARVVSPSRVTLALPRAGALRHS